MAPSYFKNLELTTSRMKLSAYGGKTDFKAVEKAKKNGNGGARHKPPA